jgi:hypothetical protein
LNIPDTTTAESFHVDTTGNAWWGCDVDSWTNDHDNAPAYILNTGSAVFSDITATGTINALQGYLGAADTVINVSTSGLNVGTTGHIRGGQTAFATGSGFFLGYDTDAYKLSVGTSTSYMTFDGDNLDITSGRYLETFTAGEAISAGDTVCLGRGINEYATTNAENDVNSLITTATAGITVISPDNNDHDTVQQVYNDAAGEPDPSRWMLIAFDFESFEDTFSSCYLHLYCTSSGVNQAGPFYVNIYPITSAWDAATVTYNTKPTIGTSLGQFEINNNDGSIWHDIDILDLMCKIKLLGETCYGLMLKGAQSNADIGYTNIAGFGHSDLPHITGRRMVQQDKVFRAKTSNIAGTTQEYRCYNYIGIATEDAEIDTSVKIQIAGTATKIGNSLQIGADYYVGTGSGDMDRAEEMDAYAPMYRIGKAVGSYKLLMDTGSKSATFNYSDTKTKLFTNTAGTSFYWYVPLYFRPTEISYTQGGDSSFAWGVYMEQIQKCYSDVSNVGYLYKEGYMGYHNLSDSPSSPAWFKVYKITEGGIVFQYITTCIDDSLIFTARA